ncbi:hypothetical protein [uncultured Jatrophihabitans sp.]|uniref:hypothetical protein n=1 Tax=uncultured Jatrophihabitans sp. TaxID=1610747 RepID=UPI0035CB5F03
MSDGSLDTALRSYARALADANRPGPRVVSKVGTVTAVTAGTSVTVTVDGNSLTCPYVGAAPANGATVRVELRDGSPTVLGTLTGVTSV